MWLVQNVIEVLLQNLKHFNAQDPDPSAVVKHCATIYVSFIFRSLSRNSPNPKLHVLNG